MILPNLNEELLILSEAIRVEGYIMKENFQGAAISNKDVNILLKIESAYKSLYPSRRTLKLLIIVLYLKNKEKIDKIADKSGKELKFHIDKNDRLIFIKPIKDFNIDFNYIIYLENKKLKLHVFIDKDGTIKTASKINSTAYSTLQIYNSPFMRELHKEFQIPVGIGTKKSYIIDFPFKINKLSEKQVKIILDIVISCEGCVFYNERNGDRVIKIKMASKLYLEKMGLMFNRIGISFQPIRPTTDNLFVLDIRKRKNFEKLYKKIKLTSIRKSNILKNIVNSYSDKRFTHYSATGEYLLALEKNGPSYSEEMSNIIKRTKGAIYTAMGRLIKNKFVVKKVEECDGRGKRAKYYLTNKGVSYLSTYL